MNFKFGYGKARLTAQELETKVTWNRLHPEFRRRVLAMMIAAQQAGTDLGIGTGFRSAEEQKSMFLSRYVIDPDGPVSWNGKRWSKKPGVATAAPPGLSFHEETDKDGFAFAADMLGDLKWMNAHCGEFGLKHFAKVNNEPWHIQPVEFKNAKRDYKGEKLPAWNLPGNPPAPGPAVVFAYPGTPLKLGSKGEAVKLVQKVVGATQDGDFGSVTELRVKNWQKANNLLADGIVGVVTWKKMFG